MKRLILFLLVLSFLASQFAIAAPKRSKAKRPRTKKSLVWNGKTWVAIPLGSNREQNTPNVSLPDFSNMMAGGNANRTPSSVGSGPTGGGSMLVFNDNAPKGQASSQAGDAPPGDRGGKPPPGGGGDPGESKAFPYWYPICLFIDPSEQNGNAAVKGVVDMGAQCGVNVVVWPITIKSNYLNSSGAINSMAQNACNIIDAGVAKKASVSTCVKYPDTAGEMCGDPPEKRAGTAGCAQLGGGGGGGGGDKGMLQRMKNSGHSSGGFAAEGKAVPSIERSGACVPDIVAHEAQGHSQFGWPNGSSAGLGIGDPSEANAGSGSGGASGGGGGGGWTGKGCAPIKATALPNDGRWRYNPKQEIYYVKEEDPEKQWDLTDSSRKLFGNTPPPGGNEKPPLIIGGGDRKDPLDKEFFTQKPGGKGVDISRPPLQEVASGSRHKRRDSKISELIDQLKRSTKSTPAAAKEVDEIASSASPPSGELGSGGANLTFDESASKGGEISTTAVSLPPPSPNGGGGASLMFDESAAKGSNSVASGSPSSSTTSPTGGSLATPSAPNGFNLQAGSLSSSLESGFFTEPVPKKVVSQEKRVKGSALRREPTSLPKRAGRPAKAASQLFTD